MRPLFPVSSELTQILESVHNIKKIKKGSFLFQEGMVAEEIFILQSGKVKISKITPDGSELTLRLCSAGDLIGELSMFAPTSKYMLSAKVMESGEAAVINKKDLENRLTMDNELLIEFMKWMNIQNQKLQAKLRDLILYGKKGALYSTLIRLSNSFGVMTDEGIKIELPLTNQELANFCGTSREVINRMLSDLRKNRIISVDKGIITIHNLKYLKQEIDCENCPLDICSID